MLKFDSKKRMTAEEALVHNVWTVNLSHAKIPLQLLYIKAVDSMKNSNDSREFRQSLENSIKSRPSASDKSDNEFRSVIPSRRTMSKFNQESHNDLIQLNRLAHNQSFKMAESENFADSEAQKMDFKAS
jgi:hypothetical protein